MPYELLTWPVLLYIARHGESAGNVARHAAEAARTPTIELEVSRDADVPLSPLGERQARALGVELAGLPDAERPNVVLVSPYLRARRTAELAIEAIAGTGVATSKIDVVVDERLREKEFGIFDRLTRHGVEARYPEQAEMRRLLGKFYHRPPGGESFCDVVLRLRSFTSMIARECAGDRVLVVAHEVVVFGLRYLLEQMSEEAFLEADRAADIANCSLTTYAFDPGAGRKGKLVLRSFNVGTHLEDAGAAVTNAHDAPIGPK